VWNWVRDVGVAAQLEELAHSWGIGGGDCHHKRWSEVLNQPNESTNKSVLSHPLPGANYVEVVSKEGDKGVEVLSQDEDVDRGLTSLVEDVRISSMLKQLHNPIPIPHLTSHMQGAVPILPTTHLCQSYQ